MSKQTERVTKRLERLRRDVYKTPTPTVYGRRYYYTFGWTAEGKAVCWGPFATQDEADSALTELAEGEVFQLETKDIHRAVRQIRDELIARGADPDEALKRMLHKR